jgi:starvation-inducible DNA-binding protein
MKSEAKYFVKPNERADRASARLTLHHQVPPIQAYGDVVNVPIALDAQARAESVTILNQILAETMTLRDLYKKHHWQVSGATFYQLHLLYDKHYKEQVELMDMLAERIQTLGGVSLAMGADVAEMTAIPRTPRGREHVPAQISRLLEAHETVIQQVRRGADRTAILGDQGSNDLLVSDVLRTNEMQVWFLSEHLASASSLTDASHRLDAWLDQALMDTFPASDLIAR